MRIIRIYRRPLKDQIPISSPLPFDTDPLHTGMVLPLLLFFSLRRKQLVNRRVLPDPFPLNIDYYI
jgi:hypothetical protein